MSYILLFEDWEKRWGELERNTEYSRQKDNVGTESKDGPYDSGIGLALDSFVRPLAACITVGKSHNFLGSHPHFIDEELAVPTFSLYTKSIYQATQNKN